MTTEVYSWEIRQQLDDARTSYADRLTTLLEQYGERRSIQAHMIRDVADLAAGRVAEVELFHDQQRTVLAQAHAAEVARLEQRVETYRESAATYARLLEEKRTIREERKQAAGAEDCDVVISNGYHGWTVAGLEEIAYRLRCGGAVDDTPVDVDKNRATASVPAPNMVTLDASPKAVAPRQSEPPTQVVDRPRFIATNGALVLVAAVSALVALVALILGVVVF